MPGQRQRRQPQPRRPPLGPVHQQRQRRVGQLHPRRRATAPRASARLNRRSSARISVSSPSSRNRCNPSRTSCRVASTNRSSAGARITSSSSCRRAWSEPSSCTSSITSHSRSSSGARSFSSRSTIAHPSRSGAAVSSRTSADPADVRRSAPSTASQNRCGSRSSRPTGTHAARSARPACADPGPQQHRLAAPRRRRHHRHPPRRPQPLPQPRTGHHCRPGGAAAEHRMHRDHVPCAGDRLVDRFISFSLSPSQRRRICGWLPLGELAPQSQMIGLAVTPPGQVAQQRRLADPGSPPFRPGLARQVDGRRGDTESAVPLATGWHRRPTRWPGGSWHASAGRTNPSPESHSAVIPNG